MEELSTLEGDSLQQSEQDIKMGIFTFFFFFLHRTACGILGPQPGIEPVPPAVEAQSLSH